ncbi:glycosyltransferase [uncultured Helicobacter sp.]|uniref:glycosyltransferase n=1 Tax=uncultured Helicobacter sp. TaxID=175537 RepID=UPI00374F76F8
MPTSILFKPMPTFILLGKSDCANRAAISHTQIEQWQAQNLITYAGESSDVRGFIQSCSCVVLPSYYKEGVPRVLLEAMSMGKPIITTNVSGCKECVKPPFTKNGEILIGQNGILIPPRDSHALMRAMEVLRSFPRARIIQMGEAGRRYAIERFSMERVITSYHTAITSCKDASTISRSAISSTLHHSAPPHTPKDTRLAFVSNTAFAMLCFRRNVLESLRDEGYEIHIIAPLDSHAQTLRECGFYTHHIEIDSKGLNPLKDFRTALHLRKILKSLKPAMVFNYTIKPAIYGSLVANALHIPNIAVITGLGYVFIDGGRKRAMLRVLVCAMYKIALKTTKQVWFLNSDDKAQFLEFHLITPAQAFLLDSEGVDTLYFSPQYQANQMHGIHKSATSIDSEKSKTTSGIAESSQAQDADFRFLLIARMLWDKGVGEFVEAARILLDSHKGGGRRLKFYLLGSCDVSNRSVIPHSQIELWEKEGIICYLGFHSDVRPFIESSSCVVLPSYREGVPISLLEAMSMGKPIITTDTNGCREVVRDGINGFVCQVKNVSSLAKAMYRFTELSKAERLRMGENAREFVTQRYDIQRIIQTYKDTINHTLKP